VIVSAVERVKISAVYQINDYVRMGGLVSYGPELSEMFRRSAHYVDRILKGGSPAEMPVEQPTGFKLIINLRTAKNFGLAIPPTLLARADEVIE
jgi:putative ABC transport system substrate-binding protein